MGLLGRLVFVILGREASAQWFDGIVCFGGLGRAEGGLQRVQRGERHAQGVSITVVVVEGIRSDTVTGLV